MDGNIRPGKFGYDWADVADDEELDLDYLSPGGNSLIEVSAQNMQQFPHLLRTRVLL